MAKSLPLPEIYLARHGATVWSVTHQHTGRSDIPLTQDGEREAEWLGARLRGVPFQTVLTSPLVRAHRTAVLAGFTQVIGEPDLMEWDYGRYDGLTTAQIHAAQPGWQLFEHGCPNGETVADATARADRILARLRQFDGKVLVFSHGHFLRLLAARWLGLPADAGRVLVLDTASLSILGYEHSRDEPVIRLWNEVGRASP